MLNVHVQCQRCQFIVQRVHACNTSSCSPNCKVWLSKLLPDLQKRNMHTNASGTTVLCTTPTVWADPEPAKVCSVFLPGSNSQGAFYGRCICHISRCASCNVDGSLPCFISSEQLQAVFQYLKRGVPCLEHLGCNLQLCVQVKPIVGEEAWTGKSVLASVVNSDLMSGSLDQVRLASYPL